MKISASIFKGLQPGIARSTIQVANALKDNPTLRRSLLVQFQRKYAENFKGRLKGPLEMMAMDNLLATGTKIGQKIHPDIPMASPLSLRQLLGRNLIHGAQVLAAPALAAVDTLSIKKSDLHSGSTLKVEIILEDQVASEVQFSLLERYNFRRLGIKEDFIRIITPLAKFFTITENGKPIDNQNVFLSSSLYLGNKNLRFSSSIENQDISESTPIVWSTQLPDGSNIEFNGFVANYNKEDAQNGMVHIFYHDPRLKIENETEDTETIELYRHATVPISEILLR